MDEQIYTCRRNDRRQANRQREWQVGAEVMSCYSQIAVSHSLSLHDDIPPALLNTATCNGICHLTLKHGLTVSIPNIQSNTHTVGLCHARHTHHTGMLISLCQFQYRA